MKHTGQMAGAGGSDILAAGTFLESNGTLKKPIYAVEWCGTDATISAVLDRDGLTQDANIVFVDDATAITTDMGTMFFGFDVYGFTTDVQVKVYYAF